MQAQLDNPNVSFDRRAYVLVASLSAFASFLFLSSIVFADVMQIYFVMSHAAKEVVLANVQLAKQVCFEACRQVFLIQMLSLGPSAAVISALVSCLWLRSFSKKYCFPTKREILFCIWPAPLVALAVFFWNPHLDFQLPFDPSYWRSASADERGRLVPWLIRSFKYQNLDANALQSSLGDPDFKRIDSDRSGYLGYKTGGLFKLQNCIFFYFDRDGKAYACDSGGERSSKSSIYD